MQVIGSDKFKFFPVRFNDIVMPFGDILVIKSRKKANGEEYVEISTVSGNTYYPFDMTFDKANEIYSGAFKECEFY
jgi:hypothetical protein